MANSHGGDRAIRRGDSGDAQDGPAAAKARSTLERAFELARSGECRIVGVVVRRLKAEGYMDIDHHLAAGRDLRDQLAKLCKEAQAAPNPFARKRL